MSAKNTFPIGVHNVICLTEIELCVGRIPALLYNSCQRAADKRLAMPSKHTASPCCLIALAGRAVVIHIPGPGGEEKLSNPIPQQPKAIGLSGCVILPLSLKSGPSHSSW